MEHAILADSSIPLVHTIRGNIPADSVELVTAWEHTDDRSVLMLEYRCRASGEVVRRDVHVGVRKSLVLGAAQASLT